MQKNIKSVCYITGAHRVLQINYTSNKLTENKIRFVIIGGTGGASGDVGNQMKVPTYSYKINKYQEYNVKHDNIMNIAVCYR